MVAKYIFITGGVLSGLGKGVVTASTGLLLASMGYNVTAIKIDPYVNVDAGTMNPYMHGEVFVTEDGGETDLDIGHYERFLNKDLSKMHNITTGKIFYSVIMRERRGEYLGRCVQIIPHVTDEIKRVIKEVVEKDNADIALIEIGGTVGDIESLPFLEASRQFRIDQGLSDTMYIHVALSPILPSGEQKTKPVQHSVNELRRIGIQPDAIVVRSGRVLDDDNRFKIALYSSLPVNAVFSDPDVDTIYRVPLILHHQGYTRYVVERLGLEYREPDLSRWMVFVDKLSRYNRVVKIALIGKYTKVRDSYLSIVEALKHSGAWNNVGVELSWFEASDIERDDFDLNVLEQYDGALILPGFGKRGAEGKVKALKFLRENDKHVLGICFGMQLMVVEYARNVVGLDNANSIEIDPNTPHPVVDYIPGQERIERYGGSMRLGSHPIRIVKNTIAYEIYGREMVYERHRHRYVVSSKYIDLLERNGLTVSGWSVDENYPEIIEARNHRSIYIGTQFHPEYRSRPLNPSPIYMYYIRRIVEQRFRI